MIVLPAHRANPDRGVSPTKASTPEEAAHRRRTWALARGEWDSTRTELPDPARAEAWAAIPMPAKTELYWRHYDTPPARTVPSSASTRPSKAPTADERDHREQAWRMALAGHASALPEGTDPQAARRAWDELEWPDKALRYWTAYDDPTSRPLPPTPTHRGRGRGDQRGHRRGGRDDA